MPPCKDDNPGGKHTITRTRLGSGTCEKLCGWEIKESAPLTERPSHKGLKFGSFSRLQIPETFLVWNTPLGDMFRLA